MKLTDEQILGWIAEVCGGADALDPSVDLLDSGLLDSLAFITLLDRLEDAGVCLQPTRVDKSAFRSARSIVRLVRETQERTNGRQC